METFLETLPVEARLRPGSRQRRVKLANPELIEQNRGRGVGVRLVVPDAFGGESAKRGVNSGTHGARLTISRSSRAASAAPEAGSFACSAARRLTCPSKRGSQKWAQLKAAWQLSVPNISAASATPNQPASPACTLGVRASVAK